MLDLKWDAAAARRDDGDTVVQGLGDFDFEAFARRELERDVGVGHEHVEELVHGANAHDDYVVFDVGVEFIELLFCLIEDDGCIGVVDGAVAGNDKLWDLLDGLVFHIFSPKDGVRSKNVGDTLGGIETSDLCDIWACWECQAIGTLVQAGRLKLVHVVLCVPTVQLLVQTIEPVSRGRKITDLLCSYILGHEFADRVTDENITLPHVVPYPVPNFGGGRTFLVCQIGAYLDVTSEKDRTRGV